MLKKSETLPLEHVMSPILAHVHKGDILGKTLFIPEIVYTVFSLGFSK